jgi:ectoine hydroxylase-related dioxygenase (phytanoyl-CoA dioxygenase family)
MMSIVNADPDASADVLESILRRDGAVIVEGLADAATIDAIAEEMAPYIAATPYGSDGFSGRTTRRTGALVARSRTSHRLIQHPLILDVAERMLDRATTFQLHLTQTIAIEPGSPAQAIHRDEWAFDLYPFPSDHHVQCNTIWAMTDFTEENGATRLIPGSQDWPIEHGHQIDETVPAEMGKGSCLLYTGKVYHGGGANASDHTRTALNITYNVGWLRQEENQYLSVPPAIAAELPRDLQRLIGYRIGSYALGYIDDVRDPIEALRGEATGRSGFGVDQIDIETVGGPSNHRRRSSVPGPGSST